MKKKQRKFLVQGSSLFLILLCLYGNPLLGQGTREDYDRANSLQKLTQGKVYRTRITPNWFDNNKKFWYRIETGEGKREFVLVDAEKGTRSPAFDHARMAEAFTKSAGKAVEKERLPVEQLEFKENKSMLVLRGEGKAWECDLSKYSLSLLKTETVAASSLKGDGEIRPSVRTGPETSIIFVNKSQKEVGIFWVNAEGRRQPYGTVKAGGERQQHTFAGHVWLMADSEEKVLGVFEAVEEGGRAVVDEKSTPREPRSRRGARGTQQPRRGARDSDSPDGKWQAFFKDNNLAIRSLEDGEEFSLSTDGSSEDSYGGRIYWSPDSKKVVAVRTRKGDDRKVYYVESSPKDQLQPKLHSYDYLKPGDKIPLPKPQLFDLQSRKQQRVSDELFSNPWSITDIRWERDSSRLTFLYNQRGHQILRLLSMDAASGEVKPIIDEQSKTFIDYSGKQYIQYLDNASEVVWMSERDGWNHLYLYDYRSGRVKKQITKGNWVVREVDRVDEEKRQIWFRAGGIRPGQDPYYVHYCRINFDGSGLVILTEGDGTHSITYSPDQRFIIDTWSRVDKPPVIELRNAETGSLLCLLEEADWSELIKAGWAVPERFVSKGRDGETDIFGVIWRPMKFDSNKKYPIIEDIYAGPQSAFVPKGFSAYYKAQSLAELGFIVVKMDGMGTSHRSKKFHEISWKNLGDGGFPDRIAWIKAAAQKYTYMDISKVGIFGGSAGGQNSTRAMLAHGDFYKVAVSDCGCHDNRMDKIWWNELWMGWPIGPHYEEQSNVTQAHKLQGKLMLFVGEMDENVDPASTMQVVNALIKANKDFDLLVMTGTGHGSAESPYGIRRRQDFFVRHLLGVEPRSR